MLPAARTTTLVIMSVRMDSGAHFHRCDFQVHTPRDPQWHGPRPTTADERRVFAERFVAACREKGLQAVAITDHHDLALFPAIKQAAQNEKDAAGDPLPEEVSLPKTSSGVVRA